MGGAHVTSGETDLGHVPSQAVSSGPKMVALHTNRLSSLCGLALHPSGGSVLIALRSDWSLSTAAVCWCAAPAIVQSVSLDRTGLLANHALSRRLDRSRVQTRGEETGRSKPAVSRLVVRARSCPALASVAPNPRETFFSFPRGTNLPDADLRNLPMHGETVSYEVTVLNSYA